MKDLGKSVLVTLALFFFPALVIGLAVALGASNKIIGGLLFAYVCAMAINVRALFSAAKNLYRAGSQ
jgi:hypothetical protein